MMFYRFQFSVGVLIGLAAFVAGATAQVVDSSTMTGKFMLGYQAWHACQGDGSVLNKYVHWGHADNAKPSTNNVIPDIWADTSEFSGGELFAANLVLGNGQPAKAYSCYVSNTVARHFKWMRDYGVDGVMLQRFIKDVKLDASWAALRNTNLVFTRAGAEAYGRVFCVMYDMSNDDPALVISHLQTDWTFLTSTLQVTNSNRYLRHKGKPLVAVWGLGFTGVGVPPSDAQTIINFFKSAGCTVMGGVPYYWRTLSNDSQTNSAWGAVYRSLDIVSPWSVGRYSTSGQADSFRGSVLIPDLSDCQSNNIDYMPVVFPGYSAHNLGGGTLNQISRSGGRFYWEQIYNGLSAGVPMLYGAMFDEIDEGTALYKLAPTMNETPAIPATNAYQFFALNVDGENLPNDWYLRLTGQATREIHKSDPLSPLLPISPTNSLTVLSPNGGNNWTSGAPVVITWSSTGTVNRVNIDLSTDGGATFRTQIYNASNSGSRAITAPYYASTNCRVRISATNGTPVDWSDSAFTISFPTTPTNIYAQQLWSIVPGSRSYLPESTANSARGLAYNPFRDEVYLVNTTALAINVLDGTTDLDKGTLNTTGVAVVGAGGGFSLSKIGVANDGVIYAGNVRVSVSGSAAFKLYRWADGNPSTIPVVAYSGTAGFPTGLRVGDVLAVRGAGTNTEILVGARNTNNISLLSTVDGTNFTARLIATDAVPEQSGGSVSFGVGNSFWGVTNGMPPARFDYDLNTLMASNALAFNPAQFPVTCGPMAVDAANSLLAVINMAEGGDQLNIYDLFGGTNPPPLVLSWPIAGANDNNFGLGSVSFGANRVYALDCNNGILALKLVYPGASPTLSAGRSGSTVKLSWPATSRGFLGQCSVGAVGAVWQPVFELPVPSGSFNVITQWPSGSTTFFRLYKP
jgi:hypothetical protein